MGRYVVTPGEPHDCAHQGSQTKEPINTVWECDCGKRYVVRNGTGTDSRTHRYWRRLRWYHRAARRLIREAKEVPDD